jgi:phytoene dehydrogenase-like protein
MAQRMADKFTSLGGEILLKKQAVKIDVENGKATQTLFCDGNKIRADYIILTTEPSVTFEKILPVKMPKELKADYENKRLTRFSAIQTAFACDLPALPFSADYIFELPVKYREILKTERLIIREFSHEPSFAPSGQTVIQSLTFCLENTAKDFIELRKKDKNAYNAKKQDIASAVLLAITEKFPSLNGHLKLLDVWTPASYNRYTSSQIGAFMSFAFSSRILPTRKSNRIQGLNNVIIASQWLQNPGGLPLALQNGKYAIETINKLASRSLHAQKLALKKPVKA